jgi:hypothetical protein
MHTSKPIGCFGGKLLSQNSVLAMQSEDSDAPAVVVAPIVVVASIKLSLPFTSPPP